MSIRLTERTDTYRVVGEGQTGPKGFARIVPHTVKVTLQRSDDGWSLYALAVSGALVEPDGMPGNQRCHHYSADRQNEAPEFARRAGMDSLAAARRDVP